MFGFFANGRGRGAVPPRGRGQQIDDYTQHFTAVSSAFAASAAQAKRLYAGGRFLLPAQCLAEISTMNLVYPLQFEVRSFSGKVCYGGVLEFDAPGGQCVMPDWMFNHLDLKPGDTVRLRAVALPQGGLVKLRPHQRKFVELHNPKLVLEKHLKEYPILCKGTTIAIPYLDQEFLLDVVEVQDVSGRSVDAVSTISADASCTELKVDFDRPRDMPDSPVKPSAAQFPLRSSPPPQGSNIIQGQEGVSFAPLQFKPPSLTDEKAKPEAKEEKANSFVPFVGQGRSLSGRPPPPNGAALSGRPPPPNGAAPPGDSSKAPQASAPTEKQFSAFAGAGRSLR